MCFSLSDLLHSVIIAFIKVEGIIWFSFAQFLSSPLSNDKLQILNELSKLCILTVHLQK